MLIKSDTIFLSSAQIRKFALEMVLGTAYLHGRLVVHRDLKPENLLLDESYRLKIADFGLSIALKCPNEVLRHFCGTLKYQAPEMIQRQDHSFPIDVWALGCTLYRLYYGNAPFDGPTSEAIYQAIVSSSPKYSRVGKSNNEPVTPVDIQVLKSMLQKDPAKRIKVADLLQNKAYFGDRKAKNTTKEPSPNNNKRKRSRSTSAPRASNLEPPQAPNNIQSGIEKILVSLEAISKFDVNKRICISSYKAHHSVHLTPKYWITEWIDVQEAGFGYLFNKNLFGFNFTIADQTRASHSRMMLLNSEIVVVVKTNGRSRRFLVNSAPAELAKSVNVLTKAHSMLIEQMEQEGLIYPEMEINLPCLTDLPWLLKKIFIGSGPSERLLAIAFLFSTDLIQLTFVDQDDDSPSKNNGGRSFLFDGQQEAFSIVGKDGQLLTLDLQFILKGHITDMMHNYATESLKYIRLLLDN